jgi:hypothetical protein
VPGVEEQDLWDTMVVWPSGPPGPYGDATLGPPVEVACHWKESRREAGGAGGTQADDATAAVERPLRVGDVAWLGTLAGWTGSGDLMRIVRAWSTADVKGQERRHHVAMSRYKGRLP